MDGDTNLLLDDLSVDLSCRDVVIAREGDIQVSLVVSKVQIDLSAIVKDIHLTCRTSISGLLEVERLFPDRTVLLGSDSSRIYVHVGVDFNGRDLHTDHLEQQAGGGSWRGGMVGVEAKIACWRPCR